MSSLLYIQEVCEAMETEISELFATLVAKVYDRNWLIQFLLNENNPQEDLNSFV